MSAVRAPAAAHHRARRKRGHAHRAPSPHDPGLSLRRAAHQSARRVVLVHRKVPYVRRSEPYLLHRFHLAVSMPIPIQKLHTGRRAARKNRRTALRHPPANRGRGKLTQSALRPAQSLHITSTATIEARACPQPARALTGIPTVRSGRHCAIRRQSNGRGEPPPARNAPAVRRPRCPAS